MPLVTNEEYRHFIDTGLINVLSREEYLLIRKVAEEDHISGTQAGALVTLLYYMGRRPSEIVDLKSDDFKRDRRYLQVTIGTKKRGKGSIVYLPMNDDIRAVWNYIKDLPPRMMILWQFRGKSDRVINGKRYTDTSYKVQYWIKKWSKKAGKKIPPYFFRHNRLSELAMKGADVNELMHFKGSKSVSSVMPYVHLSPGKAKKLARLMK